MINQITLGSKVAVELKNQIKCYEIVEKDSEPENGKISYGSPLGRALLGHRPGEKVRLNTPSRQELEARIIEVWPRSEYEVLIF
jgi:transcription elongation GreA/GreB family factor